MDKTLFVLEVITFEKKRRRHREDYQAFTTEVSLTFYYERLEDAESRLMQIVNGEDYNYLSFYCFYIKEIPFKYPCYHYWDASCSVRLYDVTAKKIDERLYPSYLFGNYFSGRPKEKQRFQIGDVVEYEEELWIVVSVPEERYDRMLDSSDDSYSVIYLEQDFKSKDGAFHTHSECIKVMTPRFPITERVQQQIECVKEWYFQMIKE